MDNLNKLLGVLSDQPLVVSVQASEGSPVDDGETLLKLARASLDQGIRVLRLEGADRVERIRAETKAPTIGLIKRKVPGFDVVITPTFAEVDALLATRCEVIAFDATPRPRPGDVTRKQIIDRIQDGGALAMADCDHVATALQAQAEGADLIGTTLSGYTPESVPIDGPDLAFVTQVASRMPVLAEGRYTQRWQVEAALRAGAQGVVVGGAINDPVKTTRALLPRRVTEGPIGAVDIGGTWMRFATFSSDWKIQGIERERLHPDPDRRIEWIRTRAQGVKALGIASGGQIDPGSGRVLEAKEIIPAHVGVRFAAQTFGVPTRALNDGLASAWAHACLPEAVGSRVGVLSLGTGVGCGFAAEGRLLMGGSGNYPRLNDLPFRDGTIEDALGGANLGPAASSEPRRAARAALRMSAQVLREVLFAQIIYVGGAVGLSEWMGAEIESLSLRPSPFGEDAGLFGAAALILFPPENLP